MPATGRVGASQAGGIVNSPVQSFVTIDGLPVSVVGDGVVSHPPCPNPSSHCAANMAQGSSLVTIDGINVCRNGDAATCGHPLTNGAGYVDIGD